MAGWPTGLAEYRRFNCDFSETFQKQPSLPPSIVTPAKAGVHHLRSKFYPWEMDSRLRGNDE